MKKLFLFTTALFTVSIAAHAYADTQIGVIDTRKIIEESSAGKSLSDQLKTRQQALQKEAADYEKKLKAEEQDIINQKDKLKPEEFDAKRKKFQQEFTKSQQTILTKSQDLDTVRKSALAVLQKDVAQAAASVADTKKLQIIIDRGAVVLAKDDMDVTADVLSKLNADVKSIPLNTAKK